MASVAATPVSEAESANAPTPTPATPVTAQHASSFAGPKTEGQGQANMMPGTVNGGPDQMPPPQPDPNMQFGLEGGEVSHLPPMRRSAFADFRCSTRILIACLSTMISATLICSRTLILSSSYKVQTVANSVSIHHHSKITKPL